MGDGRRDKKVRVCKGAKVMVKMNVRGRAVKSRAIARRRDEFVSAFYGEIGCQGKRDSIVKDHPGDALVT
jgi:hypothetical protein